MNPATTRMKPAVSHREDSPLAAYYLGIVPYKNALALQEALAAARAQDKAGDVLLLLEHPPVFTTGRYRGGEELLVSPERLRREGIALVASSRGGSITYHGPGQLVGYPIINLREVHIGVREYVWRLEEAIIRVLLARGITGRRRQGHPGVWAGGSKIASIGIHVSRGITMHGLALNVDNDLRPFRYIHPCGLKGTSMTSIAGETGRPAICRDTAVDLAAAFAAVFGRPGAIEPETPPDWQQWLKEKE